MKRAALLLALAVAAGAAPMKQRDEVHPRSPGTPLEIPLTPYVCTACLAEGRLPAQEFAPQLWSRPLADVRSGIDLDPDEGIFIETPRFRIFSTLKKSLLKHKESAFAAADVERLKTIFPKLRGGRDKTSLDAHQRAHLYHVRAERIYAHFAALTDNKEPFLGMGRRYEIVLFDDYSSQHAFVDKFLGRSRDRAGVRAVSLDKPYYLLFTTCETQVAKEEGKGDHIFSNHVIHNIAHNLADGHGTYHRETWAWLEEGLAHYYTRRENEKHHSFCWSEGKPPNDLTKSDWEQAILNIIRRKKDRPLSSWCEKLTPGELTGDQHALSWGLVRWLVETEPVRFTKLLRKLDDLKANQNCEQCIEDAFGVGPGILYGRWREHVEETYKKR